MKVLTTMIDKYPADQCREMGLKVGDTIEGCEGGKNWSVRVRLTLLWVGEQQCAWKETRINNNKKTWSDPIEKCNWNLGYRKWVFVNTEEK